MRQIGHGLHRLFKPGSAQLVEQQCKNNRKRKPEQNIGKADDKGIQERPAKINALKKLLKILKTNPLALKNSLTDIVLLKCNHQSEHRPIQKECIKHNDRNGK